MPTITYNLQKWYKELTELKDSLAPAAMSRVVSRQEIFHSLLWDEARRAIEATQEYDLPEFKSPLKAAIFMADSIKIRLVRGEPAVEIDLDSTAGNISDYASAVERARESLAKGTTTINQASNYWKYFIYMQGREGLRVKARRTKGQRGRTPLRGEEGAAIYKATITERLQAIGTLAPFWSLIDKGNVSVPGMDRGGRPYPTLGPTNFVDNARRSILAEVITEFNTELELLFVRLEAETYGENGILNQIAEAMEAFGEASARSWTPGQILRELRIREKDYKLYITRAGNLGLSLI